MSLTITTPGQPGLVEISPEPALPVVSQPPVGLGAIGRDAWLQDHGFDVGSTLNIGVVEFDGSLWLRWNDVQHLLPADERLHLEFCIRTMKRGET